MLLAKLKDNVVSIHHPEIIVSITYPFSWMAANAYSNIRECCERYNKEPANNPSNPAKIYAFGEIHTWSGYLKRLCLTVEKIGAKISLKSVE